jgi:hypothetical protein
MFCSNRIRLSPGSGIRARSKDVRPPRPRRSALSLPLTAPGEGRRAELRRVPEAAGRVALPAGPDRVLHAKPTDVEEGAAFVSSGNLTEAALDRNIAVWIASRDLPLAASPSHQPQAALRPRPPEALPAR